MREIVAVDNKKRLAMRAHLFLDDLASNRQLARSRLGDGDASPLSCGIPQYNPSRCMIAGVRVSTHIAIHAGALQSLRRRRTQQQMIESQPRIALPTIPRVVPECVHWNIRMQRTDRIEPA